MSLAQLALETHFLKNKTAKLARKGGILLPSTWGNLLENPGPQAMPKKTKV